MTVDAMRKVAAEFLGTAALLAVVVGSGIMGERLAGGNTAIALLANSLATAAALFVLISVLAPISGAHFNPLVSVAELEGGTLCGRLAVAFVMVQVLGGLAGVWIAHAMFELPVWQSSLHVRTGWGQWIAEAVASFVLMLVIRMSKEEKAATVAARVACTIGAAYWFTASTSFANPAVTLARAFTDTFAGIRLMDVLPFAVSQFIGAGLAVWAARWLTARR